MRLAFESFGREYSYVPLGVSGATEPSELGDNCLYWEEPSKLEEPGVGLVTSVHQTPTNRHTGLTATTWEKDRAMDALHRVVVAVIVGRMDNMKRWDVIGADGKSSSLADNAIFVGEVRSRMMRRRERWR